MATAVPRVLVVDDDEDGRLLVAHILRDAGIEAEVATDGAAALEKLSAGPPDLLILDLMMPFLDGWDVLDRLQRMSRPPAVVVLTARGDYDTFVRSVREGAVAHLVKPFDFEQLLAACEECLRARAEEASLPAAERRLSRRRLLMVEVKVLPAGGPGPVQLGMLVDVGARGLQLRVPRALEPGTRVRVAFCLPAVSEGAASEGTVQWCRKRGDGHAVGVSSDALATSTLARALARETT